MTDDACLDVISHPPCPQAGKTIRRRRKASTMGMRAPDARERCENPGRGPTPDSWQVVIRVPAHSVPNLVLVDDEAAEVEWLIRFDALQNGKHSLLKIGMPGARSCQFTKPDHAKPEMDRSAFSVRC
jgi:hypothetical protein